MTELTIYENGKQLRLASRNGLFEGQTAGQAPHHLQGNLVILPSSYAQDFLLYCSNNPKPCPLIGLSVPGDMTLPDLGDIDIRTDVPKYFIYRNGTLANEVSDIKSVWSDDLVTFVLGCSFSFEDALIKNGFTVRHIAQGSNVPMFKTNIETIPGGIFSGPLVVSMRPFPEEQISSVFDISAKFQHAHGGPVFWGDPAEIGISDLQSPDYGDPVAVSAGEIPVFWACGVTPQAAIERARPNLSITHAPGCMLVTDWQSTDAPKLEPSLVSFEQAITNSQQHCLDILQ